MQKIASSLSRMMMSIYQTREYWCLETCSCFSSLSGNVSPPLEFVISLSVNTEKIISAHITICLCLECAGIRSLMVSPSRNMDTSEESYVLWEDGYTSVGVEDLWTCESSITLLRNMLRDIQLKN